VVDNPLGVEMASACMAVAVVTAVTAGVTVVGSF